MNTHKGYTVGDFVVINTLPEFWTNQTNNNKSECPLYLNYPVTGYITELIEYVNRNSISAIAAGIKINGIIYGFAFTELITDDSIRFLPNLSTKPWFMYNPVKRKISINKKIYPHEYEQFVYYKNLLINQFQYIQLYNNDTDKSVVFKKDGKNTYLDIENKNICLEMNIPNMYPPWKT